MGYPVWRHCRRIGGSTGEEFKAPGCLAAAGRWWSITIRLTILAIALCLAPQGVSAAESISEYPRIEISLNGIWEWRRGGASALAAKREFVRVPGAAQLDDLTHEVSAWYRKSFFLPESLADSGARWLLRLEKAGWETRVVLNGKQVGVNYGSYLPFEFDVTDALLWQQENEIRIYVRAADAETTLPGEIIPSLSDSMAYRAGGQLNRNWARIAGDVVLRKRPKTYIAFHQAVTSVREKKLTLRAEVRGAAADSKSELHVKAYVCDLDSGQSLFEIPLHAGRAASAREQVEYEGERAWTDPILWGFGPYGRAHLYGLRLELRDSAERLIDAMTSRFGFREIWYEGAKLMLNGRELMVTASSLPSTPERTPTYMYPYGNFERNQITRFVQVLRTHGWNALHNHFDTFSTDLYHVADELGFLIVAGAYCSGQPWLAPRASMHAAWPEFMHEELAGWVRHLDVHPSIVMWSLVDGLPYETDDFDSVDTLNRLDVAGAVRMTDAIRPIIGEDVEFIKCGLARLDGLIQSRTFDRAQPRFVKELWGFSQDEGDRIKNLLSSLRDGGYSGLVTFGSVFERIEFKPSWPADSGWGVRWSSSSPVGPFSSWANWCDPSRPLFMPSQTGTDFGRQYRELWGDPGDLEPKVYPQILSLNHAEDAVFMGIVAASALRPNPRLVLLDSRSRGLINVRYPGKVRIFEVARKSVRSVEVDAPRMTMTMKPGYVGLIRVMWDANPI